MRGRLIFPFLAELHRLDTVAMAPTYDEDFKEPVLADADNDRVGEHTATGDTLIRLSDRSGALCALDGQLGRRYAHRPVSTRSRRAPSASVCVYDGRVGTSNLMEAIQPALTPLMPLFDIDTVVAVFNCVKAIPDSLGPPA